MAKSLDNVVFLGYIENPELYYSALDAFILPSKNEGVPITILEAMASNTSVFCFDVGCISDVIKNGKTGFFLSGAIEQDKNLILNNHSISSIKKIAKELVSKNYSFESNYNKFINTILLFEDFYIQNENNVEVIPGDYI